MRNRLRYDIVLGHRARRSRPTRRAARSRARCACRRATIRVPLALAQEWRRHRAATTRSCARAIAFLRPGSYAYTLEPPLLGPTSVDEFLFDTKAGFCEHFSSAFIFLMRAAGVPARVVTGYQGGELNPVDRIITVRQSDAHAWAEVYLHGRGWVRVDPTAAAMPRRLDARARAARSSRPSTSAHDATRFRMAAFGVATSGRRRRTSGTSGCSATTPSASASS